MPSKSKRAPTGRGLIVSTVIAGALLMLGLPTPPSALAANSRDADGLLPVDCLLPGQVRRLGKQATYVTARRPIKTTAADCEIRGGEYTAYDRADYRTALNVWLPQAKSGDAEAQTHVGEIYEKGLGVEPNYTIAAAWYRKSAEQGNSRAQLNLGYLYEKGLGVPKDATESLNWYRKASGLEDDDLLFASSVEVATAETNQEIALLRNEISRRDDELGSLRSRLSDTEAQLQSRQQQLGQLNRDLERTRARLRSAGAAEAAKLRRELAAKEADLAQRRSESSGLQAQVDKQRRQLQQEQEQAKRDKALLAEQAAKKPEVLTAKAGPAIEIIDPPIALVRGIPAVMLRGRVKHRDIIGKVQAPSGLLSLVVNDQPVTLSDNGVFRTRIPVRGPETPVRIAAIDEAGERAAVEFKLIAEVGAEPASNAPAGIVAGQTFQGVRFGNYHALIIGNQNYQHFPDLETPKSDSRRLAQVLRDRYGFKVTSLTNATRYDILSALNKMRETLTDEDNLLVFYAGHGELDRVNLRGHWLPVDAEADSSANWISNIAISDILNAMTAKHVMVVSDSCYSGAMTRSSLARLTGGMSASKQRKWMEVMAKQRSRTVLSSGGLKPVLDGGSGGDHSVFAAALLRVLDQGAKVLEGQTVFRAVHDEVKAAAAKFKFEQTPQYAPIQHAGHEAGEFFFVPKG